jgi:hypothetical protein
MRIRSAAFFIGGERGIARKVMRFEPIFPIAGAQPFTRPFVTHIHHHVIFDKVFTGVVRDQAGPCVDIDLVQQILTFGQWRLVTGKEFTALTATT